MTFLDRVPERRELSPGVELLVYPEPRFKRAYLQVCFDRPLDHRRAARTLLAQVANQGCAPCPSQRALSRRLEGLWGADLEFDGDRIAECQRTCLTAHWVGERFLPAGAEVMPGVFELLRALIEQPVRGEGGEPFRPAVFEREKDQLLRRVRNLSDDRAAYASERFLAELCAEEAYGRSPDGSLEEIEALRPEDLEEARLDLLHRADVCILASGPIEADPLADALQEWFEELGRAGARREAPPAPVLRSPEALRTAHEELEVDQARLHFGFRFQPPATGQELEALTLANSILGGGSHGRLFRIVREERSLAYGIYSVLRTRKGILSVEAGIDAASFDEVREEVLTQMEVIRTGGFTDEEIEVARVNMINGLRSIGDSAGSILQLATRERQLGFYRSPMQRAEQLAAVDRDQIVAAAADWAPDLVYLLSSAPQPAEALA